MAKYAIWLANGVCECCGTKEGIRMNGSTPRTQVCGPTLDCEENRKFRTLLKDHVHRDFAEEVCEAFGVTLVNVDSKKDLRYH